MAQSKHHSLMQCPDCDLVFDVRQLPGQTDSWITACTFCGDCRDGSQTQLVPYHGDREPDFSTFKLTDPEHQECLRQAVREGRLTLEMARQHGLRDDGRSLVH